MKERKWCVYKHTNKINGKCYIGITSQCTNKRWRNGKGYKGQIFYNAIQKYGWDNFEHEILYTNLTEEEAKEKEIEYIKKYKTNNNKFGYNATLGGDGIKGYIHNEESFFKIKNPIMQFDLNGTFIKEYSSIADACRENNLFNYSLIYKCCIDKNKTAYGFIWIFKNNFEKEYIEEKIKNLENKLQKKVYQYDISGNLINEFKSLGQASSYIEFDRSSISDWCREDNLQSHYGYFWSFKNDKKIIENKIKNNKNLYGEGFRIKIVQLDNKNNLIKEFNSISEASSILKIDASRIAKICKNKKKCKTAKGFKFMYLEDYIKLNNT